MNNNSLKAEYEAFSAYGFKAFTDNKITVNINMRDGYGGIGAYFDEEEVVKIIDILEKALAEARETPDHDPKQWDDTPF